MVVIPKSVFGHKSHLNPQIHPQGFLVSPAVNVAYCVIERFTWAAFILTHALAVQIIFECSFLINILQYIKYSDKVLISINTNKYKVVTIGSRIFGNCDSCTGTNVPPCDM